MVGSRSKTALDVDFVSNLVNPNTSVNFNSFSSCEMFKDTLFTLTNFMNLE